MLKPYVCERHLICGSGGLTGADGVLSAGGTLQSAGGRRGWHHLPPPSERAASVSPHSRQVGLSFLPRRFIFTWNLNKRTDCKPILVFVISTEAHVSTEVKPGLM